MTEGPDALVNREDQVDRAGLAAAVNARLAELRMKQAQLARKSSISVATIRMIQKAKGTRYYGGDLLAAISRALDWPADYLLRIFYRLPQGDATPAARPEIDVVVEAVMERINPYLAKLAKIDALELSMSSAMDAIHQVNGRIDALVDMGHPPSANA